MNFFFFVNLNNTYTPIGAIERLKLARTQASADLNRQLYLKIEQKKNMDIYFRLNSIIIIVTYLFKHFSLYKLVN